MKIKIESVPAKDVMTYKRKPIEVGQEITVSQARAEELIKRGIAKAVEDEQPTKKANKASNSK